MPKEKSITMGVRLTADQREALDSISEATGVEVGTIIRMATDALIKHYYRNGLRLVLPIDFTEMIQVMKAPEQSLRVAEDPPYPAKAQGQGTGK